MGNGFYRIKNWDQLYETSETRKLKTLSWVKVPTKQDGGGFRRLIGMPDGASLLGAWLLILELAAKMPDRGTLIDSDGNAVTAEDLATMYGLPEDLFSKALRALSSSKISWMQFVPSADRAAEIPASPEKIPASPGESVKFPEISLLDKIRREERRGEERSPGTPGDPGSPPIQKPPIQSRPAWHLDESYAHFVQAYRAAKPDVIEADFAEAHHPWRLLDHEQKLAATAGVNRRVEAGHWPGNNAHMVLKPSNYLSRPGEWTRPIVRATGPQERKEEAFSKALAIAKEREARIRKEQRHAG